MDAITAGINLATQVLQFISTEEAFSYVSQLKTAETERQTELAKGYASDDAKIEDLEGQIEILLQAVNNVFSIFAAAGKQTAPTPVVAAPSALPSVPSKV